MKHETVFESSECPTRTRWGGVDWSEELGPGIWSVATPGHGGICLSSQRAGALNAEIPGWNSPYSSHFELEEDCDWALVALVWPELFEANALEGAVLTIDGSKRDGYMVPVVRYLETRRAVIKEIIAAKRGQLVKVSSAESLAVMTAELEREYGL